MLQIGSVPQTRFTLLVTSGNLESFFHNEKQQAGQMVINIYLEDLLVINVENVSVEDFNPDDNIEMWWKAKTVVRIREKGIQKKE